MSARFSDAIRVLEQIRSAAQLGSALGTNTVAAFGKQIGAPDHLNLITLHSAKGLEFQVVIMLGLEQGRLPWLGISAERVREARRLFYVGITRAKSEVHMLFSGSYIGRRGLEKHGASQFLLEVQGQLQ
jgi:DNA helicase-2/ATP-dependent DNA helicase PcrA